MSRRSKVLLGIGAGLLLVSMLITGFKILFSPANKVLVVTMTQDATQADRQALKDACGGLPGVVLVKDQGDPSASVQGRFPVRFDLGKATGKQEADLTSCINLHGSKVRGFLSEGDN
ncbi:MAG: hypothetical protein JWO12_2789 [Frankiales bacterium]|nr:hypothetical protein [Frankiales bacterium]